ncbi:MAG: hypothetical protein P0120_21955 [Nitrospira sp.]|nr:hypothetical protein [Nitrospira sp.]
MATAVELTKNERTGRNRLERDSIFNSISCPRCTGLMVVEQGFESMLGSSEADVLLRRCVQCGDIVDPVILQNRRSQRGSELATSQK